MCQPLCEELHVFVHKKMMSQPYLPETIVPFTAPYLRLVCPCGVTDTKALVAKSVQVREVRRRLEVRRSLNFLHYFKSFLLMDDCTSENL